MDMKLIFFLKSGSGIADRLTVRYSYVALSELCPGNVSDTWKSYPIVDINGANGVDRWTRAMIVRSRCLVEELVGGDD